MTTRPQKPEHAFAAILFEVAARECPWATFEREHVGTFVPLAQHARGGEVQVIHVGRKGRPDYRVEIDGGGLAFVELKASGDELSTAQRETLNVLSQRAIPWIVLVADNVDEMGAEAWRCCRWLQSLRDS